MNQQELDVLKLLREFCKEHGVVLYSHDSIYEGGAGHVVVMIKNTPYRVKYFCASTETVSIDSTVMIGGES
jgi:hypothetical protein